MFSIKESIRTIIMASRSAKSLVKELSNKNFDLSFSKRVFCVIHGFTLDKYFLYDLENNNYKDYINDFIKFKVGRINYPYSIVLNDFLPEPFVL